MVFKKKKRRRERKEIKRKEKRKKRKERKGKERKKEKKKRKGKKKKRKEKKRKKKFGNNCSQQESEKEKGKERKKKEKKRGGRKEKHNYLISFQKRARKSTILDEEQPNPEINGLSLLLSSLLFFSSSPSLVSPWPFPMPLPFLAAIISKKSLHTNPIKERKEKRRGMGGVEGDGGERRLESRGRREWPRSNR